jgi:uncharacterized membrane protein
MTVQSPPRPPSPPTPTGPPIVDPALASPRPARWPSLDVFRGLALCFMVVHHFLDWTGGSGRRRLPGFEGFAITDLAAPAFALGLGAAGYLVGLQIRPAGDGVRWRRAGRALRRYGEVLALGLAIDVAVGGGIDGGGVLLTLAVLGVAVSALSAAGVRQPALWWGLAALAVVVAVPVAQPDVDGVLARLWAGPFSVVVYGTFAAAGAALAAAARGRGEEAIPLLPTAGVVLVAGTAVWLIAPALVAPEGLWPPARHPGHLGFTMWGLAGSLVLWSITRSVLGSTTRLGAGLARAGKRTLLVFGAHYVVKLVLQHTGLQGTLQGAGWTAVTLLAAGGACALAMAPRPPSRRGLSDQHPAGHRPTTGATLVPSTGIRPRDASST